MDFAMCYKERKQTLRYPMDFISYMPNGMHSCVLSGRIHLEYVSDGLCKMLGYTRKELEELTKGIYTRLLVEEDRAAFGKFVRKLAEKPQKLTIEYRFIKKDGSILYASDTMESVWYEDGTIMGYSAVTDITELKEKESELQKRKEEFEQLYYEKRLTEERLRMASQYSGIIFYEYDIRQKRCIRAINVEKILGYTEKEFLETKITMGISEEERLKECILIHEEDKENWLTYKQTLKDTGELKCEIRIRHANGEYRWNIVNCRYIINLAGERVSVVGCLCDVDKSHRRLMELQEAAEKEPMTKLYNKVSAKMLIEQNLKERSRMNHALMVLDLDNFKKVNDTYGHSAGDTVLLKVAELMQSIFKKEDTLSRFGGDEFVVFISDIISQLDVEKKAQCLNMDFLEYARVNYPKVPLSISIGIAFSSKGCTLESLFEKADKALYEAKRKEKNQYVCFEE